MEVPTTTAWPAASSRTMWCWRPAIVSWPRPRWASWATRLPIVPEATKSPASLPSSSAARSSRAMTVGSSPKTSSPTSAAAIARRISAVGLVTVSDRRSIMSMGHGRIPRRRVEGGRERLGGRGIGIDRGCTVRPWAAVPDIPSVPSPTRSRPTRPGRRSGPTRATASGPGSASATPLGPGSPGPSRRGHPDRHRARGDRAPPPAAAGDPDRPRPEPGAGLALAGRGDPPAARHVPSRAGLRGRPALARPGDRRDVRRRLHLAAGKHVRRLTRARGCASASRSRGRTAPR